MKLEFVLLILLVMSVRASDKSTSRAGAVSECVCNITMVFNILDRIQGWSKLGMMNNDIWYSDHENNTVAVPLSGDLTNCFLRNKKGEWERYVIEISLDVIKKVQEEKT